MSHFGQNEDRKEVEMFVTDKQEDCDHERGGGEKKCIEATVTKVIPKNHKRSSYVVTNQNITFSLVNWKGMYNPVVGQVVFLREIAKFPGGYRAMQASPVYCCPNDQQLTSN